MTLYSVFDIILEKRDFSSYLFEFTV